MFWIPASAQRQLVVELNDGDRITFVLSDEPMVTFQDSLVCITSEKAHAGFERGLVARFFFEEIPTTVEPVKKELQIEYLSDQVVIYGISQARVFDTAGRLQKPEITISDDALSISLESLSNGMYVISLPDNRSVKIRK